MKVAIIGGGPAGLATLRFLSHAHEYFPIPPIEVRLFEAEAEVGGTFSYRVYEDAELVSSKYLAAFSDFRLPDDAPDFVTPQVYVQYLKDYATNFNLWAMIECNTKVKKVHRGEDDVGHVITLRRESESFTWECDAVAVCSGVNADPVIPCIEGIEKVDKVVHSSLIKSRDQFGESTNVYIMGAGETGMDLAYLAITSKAKTIIPIPKVMGRGALTTPNKPVDTSVASLFDTAYVYPKLQKTQLLWTYYDRWVKGMHKFISGTEEGPDQWVGQMSADRKYMDSIILCKSDKALPYMSAGKRSTSWANRIRSFFMNVKIKDTDGKKIDVVTWPEKIDEDGFMQFDKKLPSDSTLPKEQLKPDVVVFATGYTRDFAFLDNDYPNVGQTNVRGIYKEGDVTLGFIGYIRPSLGAIPPLAELQAQLWVLHLLQHQYPNKVPHIQDPNALKPYDLDYQLHSRGNYNFFETKRAVDHKSYAYQLALDIGAAPQASCVTKKGWKVHFTWAMGPNFNTKFRMIGPWRWEHGAESIMRNELYNVMDKETVQPNSWVALRLPNETYRVLQVVPNTTISLGKYGSFPTNLIINRPYHFTYEVQDKREGETFARLRVVPAKELNADDLADTSAEATEPAEGDDVIAAAEGEELTLVDESGKVLIRSNREIIDDSARQTLKPEEIEELKRKGASAGKELIAKLLLSHTAIDQKTAYSLAKYKLLKTKKYIRRFTVLPLDVPMLAQWLLEDRDASKILEMRQEMMALVGCWADVHFGGVPTEDVGASQGGRWLVVDDTGGLLVASLAERMDILHPKPEEETEDTEAPAIAVRGAAPTEEMDQDQPQTTSEATNPPEQKQEKKRHHKRSDFNVPYVNKNTLTLIHGQTQPNLALLRYFNFDAANANPTPPYHPLDTNLMDISWLQLLAPEDDDAYNNKPPEATPEEIATWKTNRRGNYHRKRRRWARIRHVVDTTRAGGFSGLAVASTMDPISIVRSTVPLLAGGAPIAIYSPTIEPLTQLADCFSVARRAAWVSAPPPEVESKTPEELECWEGSEEFPINPTLLLGVTLQTSRARRWQVLPGRTHPFMMARGGADGFLFTAWRAVPVEGKIEARGKFKRRKLET
ncbi:tRNA (adenine-N(1)-)-methyltransferase non-catalytic subunit [Fusarium austroafricanum]|uniref:tRNA (adenine(58)-N(1))-methyltransferase non-catalytic subunit TRM6 n=1 Tax=Fusarium austroafricanum TaxID=2364996 RepID=A0A8H4KVK8_9HYPO|nr:tRNA (adenine-N(1)-)-methyltransferase non-catalytic subunit [Fusarium austroafricanum]